MVRAADKLRSAAPGPDGQPPLEADEEVLETFDDVILDVGKRSRGTGRLIVTSRRVVWFPTGAGSADGVAAAFRDVGMHGLVRPEGGEDGACVYLQLDDDDDVGVEESDDEEDDVEDEGDGEDDSGTLELFLRALDESRLDGLYAALSRGAELNPDEFSDDDDEDDGAFFDRDSVLAGAARALGLDDSRFDDDEDDEQA